MSAFLTRLEQGPPIVADGGMGALISAAVPRLRCPEEANLRSPESVISVHVGYIRAGADLIETNTFGANRPIVALMTFDEDGVTLGGVSARAAAERLATLDVAAVGANHGAGPAAALRALNDMAGDGLVLAALPNVGLASLSGARVVYPHATP